MSKNQQAVFGVRCYTNETEHQIFTGFVYNKNSQAEEKKKTMFVKLSARSSQCSESDKLEGKPT